MIVSLLQINNILMALNGATDSEGNLLVQWFGILNKESTKKNHLGRAKLILLREYMKPHHTAFIELNSSRDGSNDAEIMEALNATKIDISCEPISWSVLDGIDIEAHELDLLLPVINLEV